MDEMELRISELEDRIEALEKLCGSLGVRLQKAERAAGMLAEHTDTLAHEQTQLSSRLEKTEQTVSDLSEDVDDTIEDLNILSEEMRRRWKRLLAKQEQLRWETELPRRRRGADPDDDPEEWDDEDEDDPDYN